jgi:hypothetical protein
MTVEEARNVLGIEKGAAWDVVEKVGTIGTGLSLLVAVVSQIMFVIYTIAARYTPLYTAGVWCRVMLCTVALQVLLGVQVVLVVLSVVLFLLSVVPPGSGNGVPVVQTPLQKINRIYWDNVDY